MNTEDYFKAQLDLSYDQYNEANDIKVNKATYLAEEFFDFTTYSDQISEKMGMTALGICKIISENSVNKFCELSEAHHEAYLMMINMPFFVDKINWGVSIRHPFWDFENFKTSVITDKTIIITLRNWNILIKAMTDWVSQ
jgi:hypothetical protein